LGECFLPTRDPHSPSCGPFHTHFQKTCISRNAGMRSLWDEGWAKQWWWWGGGGQNKSTNARVNAGRQAHTHTGHRNGPVGGWCVCACLPAFNENSKDQGFGRRRRKRCWSLAFEVLRALAKGGEGAWGCIDGDQMGCVAQCGTCYSVADTRAGCPHLVRSWRS
jgi:hypothetical protein